MEPITQRCRHPCVSFQSGLPVLSATFVVSSLRSAEFDSRLYWRDCSSGDLLAESHFEPSAMRSVSRAKGGSETGKLVAIR